MPANSLFSGLQQPSSNEMSGSSINGFSSTEAASVEDIIALVREHKTHNRIKEAYEYIKHLPAGVFSDHARDVDCLKLCKEVLEAYKQQFPTAANESLYEKYFDCLRSLIICYLRLNSTVESENTLQQFDLALWSASELKCNKNAWSSYLTFVSGDFLCLCADLLLLKLRKAKVTDWRRICRLSAFCYATALKNKERPSVTWWRRLATFNLLQANQMLCSIRQYFEDEHHWTKIAESLQNAQVIKDLYSSLFAPKFAQQGDKTSFILAKLTPILSADDLHAFNEELNTDCYHEILYSRDSNTLDYIIWSLLYYWNAEKSYLIKSDDVELLEKSLNFAPSGASSSTVSIGDLCQLDLKAFLHFSVHCCAVRNERLGSKLKRYPFHLTAFLTNEWQKKFWASCMQLIKEGANAEARAIVSDCLNVVRLKSRNVPAFQLIYSAAMYLEQQSRQYTLVDEQKYQAMSDYAKLYWSYLQKNLQEGIQFVSKVDSPFYVNLGSWSKNDRDRILDVCKFYLAINSSIHGQYEQAMEILKKLQFPQAYYAQAEIYKKLADLVDLKPNNGDDAMLKKRALIAKAQQAVQLGRNASYFSEATLPVDSYEIDHDLVDSVNANSVFDQSSSFYATDSGSSGENLAFRTPIGNPDSCYTPKISSNAQHMQLATPVLMRSGSRQHPIQPVSSFFTDLGQSLDYTMRSLTNMNELTLRSVLDQNKSLNETVRTMTDHVRELTLINKEMSITNRELVEEFKEIRKHFAEMRLDSQKIEPAARQAAEILQFASQQQQQRPLLQQPQQQYPTLLSHVPFGALPISQPTYQQQLAAANVPLPIGQFFDQQQLPFNAANYNYQYDNVRMPYYDENTASCQNLGDSSAEWLRAATDADIAATLSSKVCSVSSAPSIVAATPKSTPATPSMFASTKVVASSSATATPPLPPPAAINNATAAPKTPASTVAAVARPPAAPEAPSFGKVTFAKPLAIPTATTASDKPSLFAAFTFGKPTTTTTSFETPKTVVAQPAPDSAKVKSDPDKVKPDPAKVTPDPAKIKPDPAKVGSDPIKTAKEPPKTVKETPKAPVAQQGLFSAATAKAGGLFGSGASPALSFSDLAVKQAPDGGAKPSPGFKGFQGAGQPVFGAHAATPKSSTVAVGDKKSPAADRQPSHDESAEEPFEPTAEFKPLIPLPALIEVKTGEENETILFKERAKLFRFDKDTNEFKERGLGDFKLLQNDMGRVRILMRREQTLKICANHNMAANMKLLPLAKSDRAYTWQCQDFADNELKSETLAIRFKTRDQAELFKSVFDKVVADIGSKKSPQKATEDGQSPSEVDKEDKISDPAGSVVEPMSNNTVSVGFGEQFKAKPGSWNCSACAVNNTVDCTICPCCGTAKDGTSPAKTESTSTTLEDKPSFKFESPVKFGFGSGAATTGTPASGFGSGGATNGSVSGNAPVGFGSSAGKFAAGTGQFGAGTGLFGAGTGQSGAGTGQSVAGTGLFGAVTDQSGAGTGLFGAGTITNQSSGVGNGFSFGFKTGVSIFGNTASPTSIFGASSTTTPPSTKSDAGDKNNVNKREEDNQAAQCPGCMGCLLNDEEIDLVFEQLDDMSHEGPRYPLDFEDNFGN